MKTVYNLGIKPTVCVSDLHIPGIPLLEAVPSMSPQILNPSTSVFSTRQWFYAQEPLISSALHQSAHTNRYL